ncbi:MAG: carotenoid 1,2-hydratase [Pseudomonadota bacterium]
MFSPFYARAVGRGPADPGVYCAFNVGLYGPRSRHSWVFSEYRPADVTRAATEFRLGANRLHWDGQRLTIDIDDRGAPLQQRIVGSITATPLATTSAPIAFGSAGAHRWWPVAPAVDLSVDIDSPSLAWQGRGYTDMNDGAEPLHEGFDEWHWCRWHDRDISRVQYRALHADGETTTLDLSITADGGVQRQTLPNPQRLRRSGWGIEREWYGKTTPSAIATIDDTPFYARSLLLRGDAPPVMHESLSLARFRRPWVRRLLPFRMRFPVQRLFV